MMMMMMMMIVLSNDNDFRPSLEPFVFLLVSATNWELFFLWWYVNWETIEL